MSEWQDMARAPRDGTWLKVRGRDFGNSQLRRHYAIAFFENENWNEVGSQGGVLYYLDGWNPPAEPAPDTASGSD